MLFTICICTCGRTHLRETLMSVGRQELPAGAMAEILVIDNAPGGPALGIVEDVRSHSHHPIRYHAEPRRGLSVARNRTLAHAKGDWLLLIDDDETADPGWLQRMHATVVAHGADAAVGTVHARFEQEPPLWVAASRIFEKDVPATGTPIGMGKAHTANAILSARFLERHKLRFEEAFNKTGGEDSDFFRRLIDFGGRVVSAQDAIVRELVPKERLTLSYFRRHSLRTGETYARVMQLHGGAVAAGSVAVRASANVIAAAALTVLHYVLGSQSQHFYRMLLLRNLGKLRYLAGVSPIEMYAAGTG